MKPEITARYNPPVRREVRGIMPPNPLFDVLQSGCIVTHQGGKPVEWEIHNPWREVRIIHEANNGIQNRRQS